MARKKPRYALGRKSLRELEGVHPDLVKVVHMAISTTEADFSVHDGLRTEAEQREYVATGVSHTMKSKHLKQADGYGHAVDLVPYINGKLRWEWPPIYKIFKAVREAADKLGVPIRWGGCWQTINTTTSDPEEFIRLYVKKRKAQGKKAFLDGPHFELRLR